MGRLHWTPEARCHTRTKAPRPANGDFAQVAARSCTRVSRELARVPAVLSLGGLDMLSSQGDGIQAVCESRCTPRIRRIGCWRTGNLPPRRLPMLATDKVGVHC